MTLEFEPSNENAFNKQLVIRYPTDQHPLQNIHQMENQ